MGSGIFFEMECLTDQSPVLNGEYLVKKQWNGSRRFLSEFLEAFIYLNYKNLAFLGVEPRITGLRQSLGLSFRTNQYIGAVPLFSPNKGIQSGDFVVIPRYLPSRSRFSGYVSILTTLDEYISPEFLPSNPLQSSDQVSPPLYHLAFEFIKLFKEVIDQNWIKFTRSSKDTDFPTGVINWTKFAHNSAYPEKAYSFNCSVSLFTNMHIGFRSLCFVYQKAKEEIASFSTPATIKTKVFPILDYIDDRVGIDQKLTQIDLELHQSDPIVVKKAKTVGIKLLTQKPEDKQAWRIDFSTVFERYCQYIFRLVCRDIGGVIVANPKIPRLSSDNPPFWSLKYLEPDFVLKVNSRIITVDAKYKSHLYNIDNSSEFLFEEHRKDLHQILAYSSFSTDNEPVAWLCYPSSTPSIKTYNYLALYSGKAVKIHLFGIPLDQAFLVQSVKLIQEIILSGIQ